LLAQLDDLIGRVRRAGYDVATGEADLIIQGLSDSNDALRLERHLRQLEGIIAAEVVYGSERATVKYIPTIISQAEIRKAVSQAGFQAVELGGEAEDAERLAREAEIARQRHLLIVGLVFTIPLFLLAMLSDLGFLPCRSPTVRGELDHVRPGNAGAVLCRLGLLRRCTKLYVTVRRTWMCSLPWAHRRHIFIRSQLRLA
jgi:copper chaperone CopZ